MGKTNKVNALMPKLMRLNYLDVAMFNWVLAFKRMLPNVKEEQVLQMFMEEYGLTPDEFSIETAHCQLNRIFKMYYAFHRGDVEN